MNQAGLKNPIKQLRASRPVSIMFSCVTFFLFLFLLSCGPPDTVLKYSLDTPPLILTHTDKAGIRDARARFREIYCAVREDHGGELPDDLPCEKVLHRISGESEPTNKPIHLGQARLPLRVLVVPGTLAECIQDTLSPLPYARAHLEEHGYHTELIMVGGRTSSTYNATQIRDYLANLKSPPSEPIILIGYSKGTTDALEAVVNHPEVAGRVSAIVSFAGVVGGSPLADSLPGFQESLVKNMHIPTCPEGDAGMVESLSRRTRQAWLAKHTLPTTVQYFSLAAFAEREQISSMIQGAYDKLATIDPRNDSQVIFYDALIPSSTLLGYVNADHWAIAMPISRDMPLVANAFIDRNAFPREVLLEAIVRFVEERLLENEEGTGQKL
jgi:pimeloyl-ACP methyl ester carboxylesterase